MKTLRVTKKTRYMRALTDNLLFMLESQVFEVALQSKSTPSPEF